jgi:hypothetical protein
MAKRRKLADAVREAMRTWGRKGAKQGGKARWKGVSAEERSAIARRAAEARWRTRK